MASRAETGRRCYNPPRNGTVQRAHASKEGAQLPPGSQDRGCFLLLREARRIAAVIVINEIVQIDMDDQLVALHPIQEARDAARHGICAPVLTLFTPLRAPHADPVDPLDERDLSALADEAVLCDIVAWDVAEVADPDILMVVKQWGQETPDADRSAKDGGLD